MNILKEKQNEPVQVLSIEICEADYAEKVLAALKKQRRTAQVPGFRVGNAPMGLIKKMYEKSFIADAVNDLMYEALNNHVHENKLDILGEPLPIDDRTQVDFEHPEKFVFTFEIAVKPEFDIDYSKIPSFTRYEVAASDEEIDNYINDLRKRHGQYSSPDVVSDNDFVTIEYGENNNGNFYTNDLNEAGKKLFIGKIKGEVVNADVNTIFVSDVKEAEFLKIAGELLNKKEPNNLNMTIKYIGHLEPAEINEEFFKKISSEDHPIADEKALRADGAAKIEAEYAQHVGQKFMNDAIEALVENVKFDLPTEFMKRYILTAQKDMTAEKLEEEYPKYEKSFKWELIENKLVKDNNIKIDEAAVKNYIRDFYMRNYFSQFKAEDVAERVDSLVAETMKNKESLKQIYDQLFDRAIGEVLAKNMNTTIKRITFKEFAEELYGMKPEGESKPKAKKSTKKAAAKEEAPAEVPAQEEAKPKKKAAPKKKATPKAE